MYKSLKIFFWLIVFTNPLLCTRGHPLIVDRFDYLKISVLNLYYLP